MSRIKEDLMYSCPNSKNIYIRYVWSGQKDQNLQVSQHATITELVGWLGVQSKLVNFEYLRI